MHICKIMWASRLVCVALLIIAGATQRANASAQCPVSIQFAELEAVGKAHRFAEYIALVQYDKHDDKAYSVTLSASYGQTGQPAIPISVPGLVSAGKDVAFVFVVRNPGIQLVTMSDIQDGLGHHTVCEGDNSFALTGELFGAGTFFDDTSIDLSSGPLVAPLEGLVAKYAIPEYPDAASMWNIQGEAAILFTVRADGSTSDFTVFKSSGNSTLDDAGITAAKRSKISPAKLPPALGGKFIDVKYLIDYTWRLDL